MSAENKIEIVSTVVYWVGDWKITGSELQSIHCCLTLCNLLTHGVLRATQPPIHTGTEHEWQLTRCWLDCGMWMQTSLKRWQVHFQSCWKR